MPRLSPNWFTREIWLWLYNLDTQIAPIWLYTWSKMVMTYLYNYKHHIAENLFFFFLFQNDVSAIASTRNPPPLTRKWLLSMMCTILISHFTAHVFALDDLKPLPFRRLPYRRIKTNRNLQRVSPSRLKMSTLNPSFAQNIWRKSAKTTPPHLVFTYAMKRKD